MKYRGFYQWHHTLQASSPRPEMKIVRENDQDFELEQDFDFESDFTDWNDLRPLIVQMFEEKAKTVLPEFTVSFSLMSIHLEEVATAGLEVE